MFIWLEKTENFNNFCISLNFFCIFQYKTTKQPIEETELKTTWNFLIICENHCNDWFIKLFELTEKIFFFS